MGWTRAADVDNFAALRIEGAIVMTKDEDSASLVGAKGPPPHVIWLTSGIASNKNLRGILKGTMNDALALLKRGESIVEIRGT